MSVEPTPSKWEKPIIVSSMARSGSTLLQRVLNVHPEITVWGEHGGVLAGIANSWNAANFPATVNNLSYGVKDAESVVGELSMTTKFRPWVSPFDSEEWSNTLRSTVLDTFTKGLTPEIRWGFKEIRYNSIALEALSKMFPEAHFVFLARDMEGFMASRFFLWGREDFDFDAPGATTEAHEAIQKFARSWVRRYWGLLELADKLGDRCSLVNYQDLTAGSERIPALFAEIGETLPDAAVLEEVFGTRAGSTFINQTAVDNKAKVLEILADTKYPRKRYDKIADAFGF